MKLRHYQARGIDDLRDGVRAGHRKLLFVLPTGGGKTVVMASIVQSYLSRSRGRVLVLAHRCKLVDQTLDKLSAFGLDAGVVMASDRRRDDAARVQVCSVQTLTRRLDDLPLDVGLILYDEAHHAQANCNADLVGRFPSARLIGFTATPWPCLSFFDHVIVAATPRELIDEGSLIEPECFSYYTPDLHDVKQGENDFNQKDLGVRYSTSMIVGSIVDEYVAHSLGRRAIVFPAGIANSKLLEAEFISRGINAKHIDQATPERERKKAFAAFESAEIMVLLSVDVLTEGFDCPAAETCILAFATMSLTKFLQAIGRVMRPSPLTGKTSALVHDHGGNLFRFGFPDDTRDYRNVDSPNPKPPMVCTDCGLTTKRFPPDGLCPQCGSLQSTPITEEEIAKRNELLEKRGMKPVVSGERVSRDQIEKIKQQLADVGRNDLTDFQAQKLLNATRADKASEYLRLKQIAEKKGYKPGFVGHKFRTTFGHWPHFFQGELDIFEPAETAFLPWAKQK